MNREDIQNLILAPFGHFLPGIYYCPKDVESGSIDDLQYLLRPLRETWLEEIFRKNHYPQIADPAGMCEALFCLSSRPNCINGKPAPHPPLHFFTFLLRKYFGYRFADDAFDVERNSQTAYEKVIRQGKIFTDEGSWDGLLVPDTVEVETSYEYIHWLPIIPW